MSPVKGLTLTRLHHFSPLTTHFLYCVYLGVTDFGVSILSFKKTQAQEESLSPLVSEHILKLCTALVSSSHLSAGDNQRRDIEATNSHCFTNIQSSIGREEMI